MKISKAAVRKAAVDRNKGWPRAEMNRSKRDDPVMHRLTPLSPEIMFKGRSKTSERLPVNNL